MLRKNLLQRLLFSFLPKKYMNEKEFITLLKQNLPNVLEWQFHIIPNPTSSNNDLYLNGVYIKFSEDVSPEFMLKSYREDALFVLKNLYRLKTKEDFGLYLCPRFFEALVGDDSQSVRVYKTGINKEDIYKLDEMKAIMIKNELIQHPKLKKFYNFTRVNPKGDLNEKKDV